ncbi:hypothetical protein F4778DRAFT_764958 [Xylariomycetidae sp. FL2044]|nr:hypothetical protein F4778DRAFT_764958 [Xylariomycetidae sp. FL2044]
MASPNWPSSDDGEAKDIKPPCVAVNPPEEIQTNAEIPFPLIVIGPSSSYEYHEAFVSLKTVDGKNANSALVIGQPQLYFANKFYHNPDEFAENNMVAMFYNLKINSPGTYVFYFSRAYKGGIHPSFSVHSKPVKVWDAGPLRPSPRKMASESQEWPLIKSHPTLPCVGKREGELLAALHMEEFAMFSGWNIEQLWPDWEKSLPHDYREKKEAALEAQRKARAHEREPYSRPYGPYGPR